MAVTVRYSINSVTSNDFVGMSIEEIRGVVGSDLNLETGAVPMVGGARVSESYVMEDDENLTFVKAAGQKGLTRWWVRQKGSARL